MKRNPENRELLTYAALGALGACLSNIGGTRPSIPLAAAGAASLPVAVATYQGKGKDAGSAVLAGLGGAVAAGMLLRVVGGLRQGEHSSPP